MAGVTWTHTANGASFRATGMHGYLTSRWAGRLMRRDCGTFIPAWDIRGCPESLGGGCRFTTDSGITTLRWDGFGWQVSWAIRGARHWLTGIPVPDSSAGYRSVPRAWEGDSL